MGISNICDRSQLCSGASQETFCHPIFPIAAPRSPQRRPPPLSDVALSEAVLAEARPCSISNVGTFLAPQKCSSSHKTVFGVRKRPPDSPNGDPTLHSVRICICSLLHGCMTMRKEAREAVAEWGRGRRKAGSGEGKDRVAEGLLRGTRTQLGSIAYISLAFRIACSHSVVRHTYT